jgi:hypothetical protein
MKTFADYQRYFTFRSDKIALVTLSMCVFGNIKTKNQKYIHARLMKICICIARPKCDDANHIHRMRNKILKTMKLKIDSEIRVNYIFCPLFQCYANFPHIQQT